MTEYGKWVRFEHCKVWHAVTQNDQEWTRCGERVWAVAEEKQTLHNERICNKCAR
jgi:hypothetical protein